MTTWNERKICNYGITLINLENLRLEVAVRSLLRVSSRHISQIPFSGRIHALGTLIARALHTCFGRGSKKPSYCLRGENYISRTQDSCNSPDTPQHWGEKEVAMGNEGACLLVCCNTGIWTKGSRPLSKHSPTALSSQQHCMSMQISALGAFQAGEPF